MDPMPLVRPLEGSLIPAALAALRFNPDFNQDVRVGQIGGQYVIVATPVPDRARQVYGWFGHEQIAGAVHDMEENQVVAVIPSGRLGRWLEMMRAEIRIFDPESAADCLPQVGA